MSETESIINFLEAGLKAEAARQRAIANNIANLQTPGYRRIDVRFEEYLAKAMESSGKTDVGSIEPEVYHPNQTPVRSNGNDVNLEAEVGWLIKNSLRHKAFIRLLNKKYNQIERAINTTSR